MALKTDTFNFTGTVNTWLIPANIDSSKAVTIEASGGQGGKSSSGGTGGKGAKISADFQVSDLGTPGTDSLYVLVGGAGTGNPNQVGGGGGGSFVWKNSNPPTSGNDALLIAGGGGGATQSAAGQDSLGKSTLTAGSFPNGGNGNVPGGGGGGGAITGGGGANLGGGGGGGGGGNFGGFGTGDNTFGAGGQNGTPGFTGSGGSGGPAPGIGGAGGNGTILGDSGKAPLIFSPPRPDGGFGGGGGAGGMSGGGGGGAVGGNGGTIVGGAVGGAGGTSYSFSLVNFIQGVSSSGDGLVTITYETAEVVTASLSLDKIATPNSFSKVGDIITYTYIITNTGSVTVGNILLTDDILGPVSCPSTTLTAGESTTCTVQYAVTQADVDKGSIKNTATVVGDGAGNPVTATDSFQVNLVCPTPSIKPDKLKLGKVGVPYNQQLTLVNGVSPIAWSIISGALPPGLHLNKNTGKISGSPRIAGQFKFTVKTVDSSACIATTVKDYIITIIGQPVQPFRETEIIATKEIYDWTVVSLQHNIQIDL